MAESHVITGLKTRRASIAAEIDDLERQRQRLLLALRHVDAVLELEGFAGDCEAIQGKRKRRFMFRRGQLSRLVRTVEHEHGADLTNREVAMIIIRRMGWEAGTELIGKITVSVRNARNSIKRRRAANIPSTGEKPAPSLRCE